MSFGFATPWVLALLVLVPLVATFPRWARRPTGPPGLVYADTRLTAATGRSWRLVMSPVLLGLRLAALALVIAALARPQTGEAREVIEGEGVDIAIALDISGSMSSPDFGRQNRLEAAKEAVGDFIRARPHDRIGLVVFASSAFLQSPPTLDHRVLFRMVERLDLAPDLGLRDGTAIGMGLATTLNMLKDSPAKSRVVILLTDGVNNTGEIDPLTAAAAAEALGIRVYTIGAGLAGLIPTRVRDLFGQRTVYRQSDLDEETLRRIADATGGRYFNATDTEGLKQIYDEINSLERSDVEILIFERHNELAGWFLAPVLVLLALELGLRHTVFRRIP